MQSITLPARVARVAAGPNGEFWAVGTSLAKIEGWPGSADTNGQVVFLHYKPATGWVMTGPPVDSAGNAVNPLLSELSISPTGEGWAVGADGTLLKKEPGSTTWVLQQKVMRGSNPVNDLLLGVSLVSDGGRTFGFVVGTKSTILRYDGSSWSVENPTGEMIADQAPDGVGFIAVSAVSQDQAWTVSDQNTNGLKIYRRLNGGWSKIITSDPIFDSLTYPVVSSRSGSLNYEAYGASISAKGNTVWIGGRIRPSDADSQLTNAQEETRPFVIRIVNGNQVTSYCPMRYRLGASAGNCIEPFPMEAYDIPSLVAISETEVFAGGFGLFHFKNGGWFREPNTAGYLVSIAFSSTQDGWAATGGSGTFFRGTTMRPESPILGRWGLLKHPQVARWPQTQGKALESVATSPDGSRAIAVGQDGAAIYFDRQLGWDHRLPYLREDLHATAWPGTRPWIVGQGGLILNFDGNSWTLHADSGRFPTLFGLAFRSASDGIGVGANGTIVRYGGSRWVREESGTSRTLLAAAKTSEGYVVVGEQGTILVKQGGSWSQIDAKQYMRSDSDGLPHLYAAATLPSGEVIVGGQRGLLLIVSPSGSVRAMKPPVHGTVLTLASGSSGRILASVSQDDRKFDGDDIRAVRGSVIAFDGAGWQDISLNRRVTHSSATDSSSFDDPVLSIATHDGITGWGAGGTPAGVISNEGHHRKDRQSGSIYRIDGKGDPSPPFSRTDISPPQGVNFAVFGESWCGRGLCSSTVGTGTQADLVALRIQEEINRASESPGGPKFVVFTGNMRGSGLPEDLAQFKSYIKGFKIPFYGALGNLDLFRGLDPASVGGQGISNVGAPSVGSNDYWKEIFSGSDIYAPWGRKSPPSYIQPVSDLQGNLYNTSLARTHYAFDVYHNGSRALRIVVVDSSTKSFGDSLGRDQNPQEPQDAWFKTMIDQSLLILGVPTIVVLNQPTVQPHNIQFPNWTGNPGQVAIFNEAIQKGVTAVLAGGMRLNVKDLLPTRVGNITVPLYITGGGGGPFGYEAPQPPIGQSSAAPKPPTMEPSDGFYHAWHMVTVDPDPSKKNLLGQAPHDLKTFMALEELGMHSYDGESVPAGQTMQFSAFARQLPGGWSDAAMAKTTYIHLGYPTAAPCSTYGPGGFSCQSISAIPPPFRFWSENPGNADFVVPDFGVGGRAPYFDPFSRAMVLDRDGQFGLLCAFKKGTVGINVESGFFRKRMVITVLPGDGPCVKAPVLADREIPVKKFIPVPPEEVPLEEVARPLFKPPPPLEPLVLVLPPAPGPIAAPAPPASAAGARKEEEEAQYEQQGDEGENAQALAMQPLGRKQEFDPLLQWLWVSTFMIAGLTMALATAALNRRRPQQIYVFERSP